jgi:hypothetical protein
MDTEQPKLGNSNSAKLNRAHIISNKVLISQLSAQPKNKITADEHQIFYLTKEQLKTCPAIEHGVEVLAMQNTKIPQEGWTTIDVQEKQGSNTEHSVLNSVINFEAKKVELIQQVDKVLTKFLSKL